MKTAASWVGTEEIFGRNKNVSLAAQLTYGAMQQQYKQWHRSSQNLIQLIDWWRKSLVASVTTRAECLRGLPWMEGKWGKPCIGFPTNTPWKSTDSDWPWERNLYTINSYSSLLAKVHYANHIVTSMPSHFFQPLSHTSPLLFNSNHNVPAQKTQQIDIIIHPNKELKNHIPMQKGYSFLPMPGTEQDLGFKKSLDQIQV